MLSLLEIAERTQKGPRMDENEWNLALFRKMQELVKRYDIKAPPGDSWFNHDEALLGRMMEAGIAYLAEMGVYCISTGRIVRFSEEEVRQTIREIPETVTVGAGRDLRVFRQGALDGKGPLFFRPAHHAPFSELYAPLVVKNFAQIPSADYMEGFMFREVDGREIFGEPMEAYAAKRELTWMREGCRKAGRPGMPIAYYPIGTRAAVLTAPIDPEMGLRPTDGCMLSVLPDMKIEQNLLTAAIVYEDYGCFKVNGGGAGMVGSFVGGMDAGLIDGIVRPLIGIMCYHDMISYAGVGRITRSTALQFKTGPQGPQATSAVCQALNKYTNIVYWGGSSGDGGLSGPGAETHLLEVGMGAIGVPLNGGHLSGSRQHRAMMDSSQDPLTAEWGLEVAQAVMRSGLTTAQADGVLSQVSEKLNGRAAEPGQHISKCYDLVRHQPSAEFMHTYKRVKETFSQAGLRFD